MSFATPNWRQDYRFFIPPSILFQICSEFSEFYSPDTTSASFGPQVENPQSTASLCIMDSYTNFPICTSIFFIYCDWLASATQMNWIECVSFSFWCLLPAVFFLLKTADEFSFSHFLSKTISCIDVYMKISTCWHIFSPSYLRQKIFFCILGRIHLLGWDNV